MDGCGRAVGGRDRNEGGMRDCNVGGRDLSVGDQDRRVGDRRQLGGEGLLGGRPGWQLGGSVLLRGDRDSC